MSDIKKAFRHLLTTSLATTTITVTTTATVAVAKIIVYCSSHFLRSAITVYQIYRQFCPLLFRRSKINDKALLQTKHSSSKMGHSRPLSFFIFVFSTQLNVNIQSKICRWLDSNHEPGVGSDNSTNWAATTAQRKILCGALVVPR